MTRSPAADPLTPGQNVGPYVLLAPLGAGGSGRVWAAARLGQLGFSKRLVLKVMRSDRLASGSARERFDREARLGARLSHPNLRAVHDLGSHGGRPYMALSWADTSLAELLEHARERRLEAPVACWIGMQCSAALDAAHRWVEPDGCARVIVHRDVSPGNILLSAEGHALLADLAAPEPDGGGSPGADGGPASFFGNIGYAAPEALRQEPLDGRADLYSLGCVLFEALAGAPAFEGDDEPSVLFQVLERGAPDLGRLAPAVPPALARVVHRCLERRREQRFQSAAELWAELSACVEGRTSFELERAAAACVQRVLGERLREREEAMHRALQRLVPSFEHTDTLPLAALPEPERATRDAAASPPELSRSDAGASIDRPALHPGRARWLALFLLVALPLALTLYARARRPPMSAEASAPRPMAAERRRALNEPARAAPAGAAPIATDAAALPAPAASAASTASAAPAAPAAAPAAGSPPSARETSRALAPAAAGAGIAERPRTRRAPRARKPPASADDPFSTLRLEADPYARRSRQGAAPPPPPRQKPPTQDESAASARK